MSEGFGPKGDLPAGPNPDVKMFIEDKRPILVSAGVLESVEKSGVLVDCPGGLLVVHELAAKGQEQRLENTSFRPRCLIAVSGLFYIERIADASTM